MSIPKGFNERIQSPYKKSGSLGTWNIKMKLSANFRVNIRSAVSEFGLKMYPTLSQEH